MFLCTLLLFESFHYQYSDIPQFCQIYKAIKFTDTHPNYFTFFTQINPSQYLLRSIFKKQQFLFICQAIIKLSFFSIIIEIMQTKLSMRNLHTFGQENPFLKQRSVSYKSKNESLTYAYQSQTNAIKEKKHQNTTKNQYKIFKDTTNRVDVQPSPTQRQFHSSKTSSHLSPGPGPGSFSFKQFDETKRPYLQGKYKNYSCEGIMHLLKHQEQSIKRVKEVIEKDKEKINKHFVDFKQTINNIIDDLKLSICCHIEEQYQQFVRSFRIVKIQYINYCNIKKQFWETREGEVQKSQKDTNRFTHMGNKGKSILQLPGMVTNDKSMINNQMLLMSVIEDIKDCKKHINYKEFAQIQQKLLRPLLKTTKNMLKQMSIQSYYKPQIAHNTFKKLQGSFEDSLHQMYERMDLFISSYRRQQQQGQTNKKLNLQNFNEGQSKPIQDYQIDPEKHESIIQNVKQNKKKVKEGQIYGRKMQKKQDDQMEIMKTQSFGSLSKELQIGQKQKYKSTANTMTNTFGQSQAQFNEKKVFFQINKQKINENFEENGVNGDLNKIAFNSNRTRKNKYVRHSLDANSLSSEAKQTIRFEEHRTILDKSNSIEINKLSQASESALCVIYLESQSKIVVGTKNGLVKIFCTKTGAKLNQLYGHRASICSLSTLSQLEKNNLCQYVVSGGDIGCCQVIIWNLRDNLAYHNFSKHHSAAITCIVDLQDSQHFVTGSFDCSLNVFNYKKKQLTKSVNTNQKITALTIIHQRSHKYIVSGNLNSQICVWKVCENTFNNITGLQLNRTISIGTYPYSIVPINSTSVIIAGKDNWVRVVNLWKGTVEKAGQVGQCQQIIRLTGANRNEPIELIGCFKNGDMRVISTKEHDLKSEELVGKGSVISFSCGISPKYGVQLVEQGNQYGYVYIPNHFNPNHTQIRVWKIFKNEKRKQTNLIGRTY